jgi:hypothetical protein
LTPARWILWRSIVIPRACIPCRCRLGPASNYCKRDWCGANAACVTLGEHGMRCPLMFVVWRIDCQRTDQKE